MLCQQEQKLRGDVASLKHGRSSKSKRYTYSVIVVNETIDKSKRGLNTRVSRQFLLSTGVDQQECNAIQLPDVRRGFQKHIRWAFYFLRLEDASGDGTLDLPFKDATEGFLSTLKEGTVATYVVRQTAEEWLAFM